MKSLSKSQFTLIVFGILLILFFVIFFANKTVPLKQNSSVEEKKNISLANLDEYSAEKTALLPDSLKAVFRKLEKGITSENADSLAYSKLIKFLDGIFMNDVAAYFSYKKAVHFPNAKNWFESGNRLLTSVQFINSQKPVSEKYVNLPETFLNYSVKCFEQGLKLDSTNTDSKIKLATCYLEDKLDPMKGITLLRKIEETDSNNVNLQLAFAFASVKSGQIEKAILRFNKVLLLDPNNLSVYLYLADIYEQQGKKELVLKTLEEYAGRVPDADAKKEIRKYIDKLKNS